MFDQISGVKQRDNTFLLECDCRSFNHHVQFSKDDEDQEVWVQMFISPNASFWKRLKNAWKYLMFKDCSIEMSDALFNYNKMDKLVDWYKK